MPVLLTGETPVLRLQFKLKKVDIMAKGQRWSRLGIYAVGGLVLAGLIVCLSSASLGAPAKDKAPAPASNLTHYDVVPYYDMYTDVEMIQVKEAAARMAAMAEEYKQRCQGFSRGKPSLMPFYLYSKRADYAAACPMSGSAGVFSVDSKNGARLMADASWGDEVWHIVQHEGFHQFAYMMIAKDLPVWLNEGMAEYFGESLWTGGGMVTGNIPAHRLARMKVYVLADDLVPFDKMITMEQKDWNGHLDIKNYDQALFMVTFLVHGAGEANLGHFVGYINDLASRKQPKAAWVGQFGTDTSALQKQFTTWVKGLTDADGQPLRNRATFDTLMSYLSRAHCEKQDFDNIENFFKAGEDGKVKVKEDLQWYLPPSLLANRVKEARALKEWSLEKMKDGTPKLTLKQADGTVYTGTVGNGAGSRPPAIVVDVKTPPVVKTPTTKPVGATSKPAGTTSKVE